MTPDDRRVLAAFVSARRELGDTEWQLSPEARAVLTATGPDAGSGNSRSSAPAMTATKERTMRKPAADAPRPQASTVQPAAWDAPGSAPATLDELRSLVCECQRCSLGQTRTKFVFGDGNPHAAIMFVGEAPGADEDAQGVPFVGRAGQLLTKMIIAMKLSREEVYIGNILKCRPPGNRDPKPEEIDVCEPILLRQLDIIRPKFICALGRIAGNTLLRTQSTLGALRGQLHDYHGVKLIVTYHPAALLRNPGFKAAAWEDLKYLRREYDGLEL